MHWAFHTIRNCHPSVKNVLVTMNLSWQSYVNFDPNNKKLLIMSTVTWKHFSQDKFLLISPSKSFCSFNFHYLMTDLFYIIVKHLEAFNFQGFASSAVIVKINCRWNVLAIQYFRRRLVGWATGQSWYGRTDLRSESIMMLDQAMSGWRMPTCTCITNWTENK